MKVVFRQKHCDARESHVGLSQTLDKHFGPILLQPDLQEITTRSPIYQDNTQTSKPEANLQWCACSYAIQILAARRPKPIPAQNAPTSVKPSPKLVDRSAFEGSLPRKDSDRATRDLSGPSNDIETMNSEPTCRGSKGTGAHCESRRSRVSGNTGARSSHTTGASAVSARLRWRSPRAISCESVPSHSASHCALSQALFVAGLLDARTVSADTLGLSFSTARSTSRHRRKRLAASPRNRARVSGVRKRPVRRACGVAGRNDESVAVVCGGGLPGYIGEEYADDALEDG